MSDNAPATPPANAPETAPATPPANNFPAPDAGSLPPASRIVVTAERTEREIQLESERDSERKAREEAERRAKAAEIKASEAEDRFHTYRKSVEKPKPARNWGFFD